MKKVLISDTLSKEGIEILQNTPGIEVDVMTNLTPDELKGIIKEAQDRLKEIAQDPDMDAREYLEQKRFLEAAIISNHAAGIVVGKIGTATVTPEELLASFQA